MNESTKSRFDTARLTRVLCPCDAIDVWTRIASIHDCPPGTALELVAGDRVIALFNVAGAFYALDGVCPHQGGPLGKGAVTGCIVTCPWHGWQFDVTSGQHRLNAKYFQPRFEVRLDGDEVLIQVAE